MRKAKTTIIFFLLITALLNACGGDSEALPTNTPASTETPESIDPGPSSLDLTDATLIKEIPGDYALRMDFAFSGALADGTLLEGAIALDGQQLSDAAASAMAISASGDADLGGVDYVEIVELDERLYFYNELNGCVYLPADAENDSLFNNLVDTGGFLTGVVQRDGPDEVINGVPSFRFAITQDNLDIAKPESMDVTTIEEGSLYIAKDGGYVVRLIIRGEGTSDLLTGVDGQPGEIDYQLDFIPADGLQIIPPEACEEGSEPESDYPVLPDAQNVAAFGTLYSYTSNASIDAALSFYKSELASDGWALEQEIAAGDTAILLFSLGERNLSVAIAGDPDNPGTLSVVIAEEQ